MDKAMDIANIVALNNLEVNQLMSQKKWLKKISSRWKQFLWADYA